MLTFQDIYTQTATEVQDSNSTALQVIKDGVNQGAKFFGGVMHREWRATEKIFSTVADQQYYQMPEDCIRPKNLTVTVGDIVYPLFEIPDERTWNELNIVTTTTDYPTHYYVKGGDQFGIFPIPSSSTANAGRLNYERRMRDMSQANYTTGTITTTNGSAAIVGVGTTFTALMVGRYLKVTDPSGDGMWYKIAAFTDTTHITLENTYAGATAGTLGYAIGEIPDIPEEFHESLKDYGKFRYYQYRRDMATADAHKANFDTNLLLCKQLYGSKITSTYTRKFQTGGRYGYFNRDLKVQ